MNTHEMHIVERGAGAPLVLIPGIQGRWEFVRAALEALSKWFHVITFSLCDEPASGLGFARSGDFGSYSAQVLDVLARTRVDRATICGISFGGLIALRFAAVHPDRTSALVLASTPGPSWHMRRRHAVYARLPWVGGPLFLAEAPWRLRDEIAAALTPGRARRRFAGSQLGLLLKAPLSPTRMAARARLITSSGAAASAARVVSPTLIVTGERALDHVVSTDGSSEYRRLIPGAQIAVLDRTGHLGSITRPDVFATLIRDFVNGHHHAAA